MVTPIEMKRGIDPSRFNGRHNVRFTSLYGESGGVGPTRRTGELDGVSGPTWPFGELDGVLGPTRPFGKLDCLFGYVTCFSRVVGWKNKHLVIKNEKYFLVA
ncbi:hypothetical protein YC2023_033216 [Brassica napus]